MFELVDLIEIKVKYTIKGSVACGGLSRETKQEQAATGSFSEKIKVWDEARDDIIINHTKHIYSYKTLCFSHLLSASGLEFGKWSKH